MSNNGGEANLNHVENNGGAAAVIVPVEAEDVPAEQNNDLNENQGGGDGEASNNPPVAESDGEGHMMAQGDTGQPVHPYESNDRMQMSPHYGPAASSSSSIMPYYPPPCGAMAMNAAQQHLAHYEARMRDSAAAFASAAAGAAWAAAQLASSSSAAAAASGPVHAPPPPQHQPQPQPHGSFDAAAAATSSLAASVFDAAAGSAAAASASAMNFTPMSPHPHPGTPPAFSPHPHQPPFWGGGTAPMAMPMPMQQSPHSHGYPPPNEHFHPTHPQHQHAAPPPPPQPHPHIPPSSSSPRRWSHSPQHHQYHQHQQQQHENLRDATAAMSIAEENDTPQPSSSIPQHAHSQAHPPRPARTLYDPYASSSTTSSHHTRSSKQQKRQPQQSQPSFFQQQQRPPKGRRRTHERGDSSGGGSSSGGVGGGAYSSTSGRYGGGSASGGKKKQKAAGSGMMTMGMAQPSSSSSSPMSLGQAAQPHQGHAHVHVNSHTPHHHHHHHHAAASFHGGGSPRPFNPVGKTGVTALHELCSKRHLEAPRFVEVSSQEAAQTTNNSSSSAPADVASSMSASSNASTGSSSTTNTTTPLHFRDFLMAVIVDGRELGRGRGGTKAAARQDAARKALHTLLPGVNFDDNGVLVEAPPSGVLFGGGGKLWHASTDKRPSPAGATFAPSFSSSVAKASANSSSYNSGTTQFMQDVSMFSSTNTAPTPPNLVLPNKLHQKKRMHVLQSVYPCSSSTGMSSGASDDDLRQRPSSSSRDEENDDAYYASRGASVCSTLLHAMWQIDDGIPEPPSYAFDVLKRTPPAVTAAGATLHRSSFKCTCTLVVRGPRSTGSGPSAENQADDPMEVVSSSSSTSKNDEVSASNPVSKKPTIQHLQAVGTGATKREARHASSAKVLALLFPHCNGTVEVIAAAEAAREAYAASKAQSKYSKRGSSNSSSCARKMSGSAKKKARGDEGRTTGGGDGNDGEPPGGGRTRKQRGDFLRRDDEAQDFARGFLDAATSDPPIPETMAKRLSFLSNLFRRSPGEGDGSVMSSLLNDPFMRSRTASYDAEGSCASPPSKIDEGLRSDSMDNDNEDLSKNIQRTSPQSSPSPSENIMGVGQLSISEEGKNDDATNRIDNAFGGEEMDQGNHENLNATSSACSDSTASVFNLDGKEAFLRQVARQRQLEGEVDAAIARLHEMEDGKACLGGGPALGGDEDDVGKIVLRRATMEDQVWVKELLGRSRGSPSSTGATHEFNRKRHQKKHGVDGLHVSPRMQCVGPSSLLCMEDDVADLFNQQASATDTSVADRGPGYTSSASTAHLDVVPALLWGGLSFIVLLGRVFAAQGERPLGCAVLTISFSLTHGRVLKISQIAHGEHMPRERFVECLEMLASCMNHDLEDATCRSPKPRSNTANGNGAGSACLEAFFGKEGGSEIASAREFSVEQMHQIVSACTNSEMEVDGLQRRTPLSLPSFSEAAEVVPTSATGGRLQQVQRHDITDKTEGTTSSAQLLPSKSRRKKKDEIDGRPLQAVLEEEIEEETEEGSGKAIDSGASSNNEEDQSLESKANGRNLDKPCKRTRVS